MSKKQQTSEEIQESATVAVRETCWRLTYLAPGAQRGRQQSYHKSMEGVIRLWKRLCGAGATKPVIELIDVAEIPWLSLEDMFE